MTGRPTHPVLYQVNTRVRLYERSKELGRPAKLSDFPKEELNWLRDRGFNWLWLMGVWQTGAAGRQVSQSESEWRPGYTETLGSDLQRDDICGSPFAVKSYTVHSDFGGDEALASLREDLRRRELRLLLDFVPNHTALDHLWVDSHPEFYIHGNDSDIKRDPRNYCRRGRRRLVFARGRDPYCSGWPDTLQLNYRHPVFRQAMIKELSKIAAMCDGLRCDMAMLVLPDVIKQTWGSSSVPAGGLDPVDESFWPEAIDQVRRQKGDEGNEEFVFLAEVYWDMEWELQRQGFNYTSDKKLYDCLRSKNAGEVRGHLLADPEFQRKSVRFLENHDEPRAAMVFSEREIHEAAAVVAYLVPGMRHFHDGQLDGRKRKVSVHLRRRLDETPDPILAHFYVRLLECLRRPEVREGEWELLECRPSSEGNSSFDRFIAFTWGLKRRDWLLVMVNYGPERNQCHVPLSFVEKGSRYLLQDLLSCVFYERSGDELSSPGLYLDMEPWRFHVFELIRV